MARLFGTDGVRGRANRDVTAELALDLSAAAAHVLAASGAFAGHRPRAVVGRDPRISGDFLSAAVCAGLASSGVDVIDVGVLPTPGVAHLTATLDVDLGVVLSASHNPMPDNGIKFFSRGGHKLPDEVEDAIESRLGETWDRPTGADVGRISVDTGAAGGAYVEHLINSVPHSLAGLRIAVDCANGAASEVGPVALRGAGAEVIVINAAPDGRNINEGCGSTHPERSCRQPSWRPAPTSGLHSTAMPTVASRSTTPGRSSTGTRSWECWLSPCVLAAPWRPTPS